MARADPKLVLRLPSELKAFVQDQAERNLRSMNSEVVHVLRQHQKAASAPSA